MRSILLLASATSLLVLLGNQQQADPAPVVVHEVMTDTVAPQAQILWDVSNLAMDDDGNPDGSRLTAGDWEKLAAAARAMSDASKHMASAPRRIAAAPGAKLQDESAPGASTVQQIQSYLDGDPKAFADHSLALAAVSDELAQAAGARDAARLMDASARLDGVCEACHVQFWYPGQAALQ